MDDTSDIRRVSTHHAVEQNYSPRLKADKYIMVPKHKLSRSASSPLATSFIPDPEPLESPGRESQNSRVPVQNVETQIDPNTEQTESLLNMTLILTASPFHIKSNLKDNASYRSNDSKDFNIQYPYKIEAVSPLTNANSGSTYTGSDKEPRHVKIEDVIDDYIKSRDSSEHQDKNYGETTTIVENPNSLNPLSGNSILDPLKGNGIQKANSIFKEPSALLSAESILSDLKSIPSEDNIANIEFSDSSKQDSCQQETGKENIDNNTSYKPRTMVTISKRRNTVKTFMWISFLVLFLTSTSVLIPLVVRYSNGTKDLTLRFFDRLNDTERDGILSILQLKYGSVSGSGPMYNETDREIMDLFNLNLTTGKIFKGITYTPLNSLEPNCGTTQRDVDLDLALLSTLTTKIRTYGMGCHQNEYVLNAIQKYNLNMTLAMGVWIDSNDTNNDNELTQMRDILKKYPRDLFDSVMIGNEVLFREDMEIEDLLEIIKESKRFIKDIGYSDLPVGTSDIGLEINQSLLKECNIIGANIHPFFGGGDVHSATNWTIDFLNYQLEPLNRSYNTKIVISEVGWPFDGGHYQASVANHTNFQVFLNDWVCSQNDIDWYYFEAYDEPWKRVFYENNNKWETEFGLFTSDRKLKKGITFPKCMS